MEFPPGTRIACTGKLASMARDEFALALMRIGLCYSPTVHPLTNVLVLGGLESPLNDRGRITRSLRRAIELRQAGVPVLIVREPDFLSRLVSGGHDSQPPQLTANVHDASLLGEALMQQLTRMGFFRELPRFGRLRFFDFAMQQRTRHLRRLLDQGVHPRVLKNSLMQLARFVPDIGELVDQLCFAGDTALARQRDGSLIDNMGQHYFPFIAGQDSDATLSFQAALQRDLSALAWDAICRGCWDEAVEFYEQLLFRDGPDADSAFNLGVALSKQGRFDAAAARFRQVLELDRDHAEAWNNLGNTLHRLSRPLPAVERCYAEAIRSDPTFAVAHRNWAMVLESAGFTTTAAEHWRAYRIALSIAATGDLVPEQSAEQSLSGPTIILSLADFERRNEHTCLD